MKGTLFALAILLSSWLAYAAPDQSSPVQDWASVSNRWRGSSISALNQAAEAGEVTAQCYLARLYSLGAGVPKDLGESRKWYFRAAEQDCPLAQYALGIMSEYEGLSGNTVIGNYPVAAEWFQKAAANGHVKAMLHLADLYYYGKIERNYREAAKWYVKAAERGDAESANRLREFYLYHPDAIPTDQAKAMQWLQTATPNDVPANSAKPANNRTTPASEASKPGGALTTNRSERAQMVQNGSTSAMRLALAVDYEEGRTGPVNLDSAAALYWMTLTVLPGAVEDVAKARERLVALYASGRLKFEPPVSVGGRNDAGGLPRSFLFYLPETIERVATLLYNTARESGTSPTLQLQIADIFYHGELVPEDWPKAVDCYFCAARAGSLEAVNKLGELWAAGVDGQPDAKEAARWYRRAAAKGLAAAQFNLAVAYQKGVGVPRDEAEAWAWFRLSADQGHKEAAVALAALESSMSPDAVQQGRQRADRYRQKPG